MPFSRGALHRAGRFPREDPPKDFFRLSPGHEVRLRWAYFIKCDQAWSRTPGKSSSCTAPTTRRPAAATPGRPQGEGHDPLGLRRPTPLPRRCACTTTSSCERTRTKSPEGQDFTANLNPNSLVVLADANWSRLWAAATPGERYQFERLGLLLRRPRLDAGQTGVQPHRNPQRHLGENREARDAAQLASSESVGAGRRGGGGIQRRRACGRCRRIEARLAVRTPGRPRRMPEHAVATCLRIAGIEPEDVDSVARSAASCRRSRTFT